MSQVEQFSEEEIEAVALAKGLICFIPRDDELFLDLDVDPSPSQRQALASMQSNGLKVLAELVTTSNGGNKHLYLRLDRAVTVDRRIALQAALGSDPIKEALSVMRLEGNSTAPIALFETVAESARVMTWRDAAIGIAMPEPPLEQMPF